MKGVRALVAFTLCVLLGGCFEIDTRVLVNFDGTGTVTERMLLKGALAEMIQSMGAAGSSMIDADDLKARARSMGPGVTLASATPLPEKQGLGHEVVFAFRDVNTLRVNQSPKSQGGKRDGDGKEDLARNAYATFHLERGPRPVLTVHTQHVKSRGQKSDRKPDRDADTRAKAPGQTPEALKKMLGGMRISVAVAVSGTIVETTATHHDGNEVTLIELDMDQILDAPDGAKTLEDLSGDELGAVKEALKRFPGVKVELEPAITITFEPILHRAGVDGAATSGARSRASSSAWLPASTGPQRDAETLRRPSRSRTIRTDVASARM